MRLRVGAASDIGRARQRNEDAYLASPPLYVVADGMGGHRGGAVASSLAIETLSNADAAPLAQRVRDANRAVFDRQAGDRSVAGMGTTVTAAEIDGATMHLAHVGDSRAYLLRGGGLETLTDDHTLVQQMVDEGKITAAQAHEHPQRNILTRVVGVDPEVDVDEETVEMREGDRLLLCSDGLTSMMRDESIAEILGTHAEPQDAADALVDAANRAGGLDNITVVVVDFEPGDGVEMPPAAGDGARGGAAVGMAREDQTVPVRRRPQPDETGMIETVDARPRRRWRRIVLWVVIALVVVAAGLTAFRVYLNGQWYVGAQNGHVAVFRGSPGDVLGFKLSGVVSETRIPARAAERFAPYRGLASGITRSSKGAAYRLVTEIRSTIRQSRSKRSKTGAGP